MANERHLEEQYTSALLHYLAVPSSGGLREASELGVLAVERGIGLQDFVASHEDALAASLLPDYGPADLARTLSEGRRFLVEALGAFHANHVRSAVLRRLNARLNTMLEEEAKRIARALHDEAGQLLASVHLALQELARESPAHARESIGRIRAMLDRIEEDLRDLCHEIRPTNLDTMGLQPAVEFLARNVGARTSLPIEVRGSTTGRLPPVVEANLYRIIQEALANAARHASADRVVVRFDREPAAISCAITDDGVGFNPAAISGRGTQTGLGLVGMHERVEALGGQLEIRSQPGSGTEILVRLPVEG